MAALRLLVCGLIVLSSLACSQKGLNQRMEFDSRVGAGADLGEVTRWNWVPKQYMPTGDPRVDDPAFLQHLEDLISGQMNARGLTQDSSSPDFLVNYEVGIKREFDDANWVNTYSQEKFSNNSVDYEQGSVMVIFFSTETGQAMWAGWARGELDPKASKSQRRDNLRKVIDKIFARLDTDRGMPAPEPTSQSGE